MRCLSARKKSVGRGEDPNNTCILSSPDNTGSFNFNLPPWLFLEPTKISKKFIRKCLLIFSMCLPVSVPLPPTVSVCQSAGVGVKNVKNGCLFSVWYYAHHRALRCAPPPPLYTDRTMIRSACPPSHDTHLQLSCQLLCPLSDPVSASHTVKPS